MINPAGGTPGNVTVTISRRTILVLLAIVAGIWLAFHLVELLLVLFSAVLLATAVHQPARWLERRGLPRALAVALIYLLLVLVLAGVVALLVPLLHTELLALKDQLPDDADKLQRLLDRHLPDSQNSQFSFDQIANQASSHI